MEGHHVARSHHGCSPAGRIGIPKCKSPATEADQARVQATQEDRRATRIEETADTAHHRYQTARIRVEDLEKQYAQPMYAIDSTESTLDFVRRRSIT